MNNALRLIFINLISLLFSVSKTTRNILLTLNTEGLCAGYNHPGALKNILNFSTKM